MEWKTNKLNQRNSQIINKQASEIQNESTNQLKK